MAWSRSLVRIEQRFFNSVVPVSAYYSESRAEFIANSERKIRTPAEEMRILDRRPFATLQMHAAQQPHKQAFVFLAPTVSFLMNYSALDHRARAIANELIVNGLGSKWILLVFPPGLDFIAALFWCFYAGAVAVPDSFLPGKHLAERMSSILRDAAAGVLRLQNCSVPIQILNF
jgi:acyl-CoA synthetase (AMP-forming)/AMP-acid ligase II